MYYKCHFISASLDNYLKLWKLNLSINLLKSSNDIDKVIVNIECIRVFDEHSDMVLALAVSI